MAIGETKQGHQAGKGVGPPPGKQVTGSTPPAGHGSIFSSWARAHGGEAVLPGIRHECARDKDRFHRGFRDSGTHWLLPKAAEQSVSCGTFPQGPPTHTHAHAFIELQTNEKAVGVYLQCSPLSMFSFCNMILACQAWLRRQNEEVASGCGCHQMGVPPEKILTMRPTLCLHRGQT